MAENTPSEQLEKRAPDAPEPDPIAESSMSGLLLISSLLLVVTLVWSVWDEVLGQRPWKGYQKDFVSRYSDYLEEAKARQGRSEAEIKSSDGYQELDSAFKEAAAAAKELSRMLLTPWFRRLFEMCLAPVGKNDSAPASQPTQSVELMQAAASSSAAGQQCPRRMAAGAVWDNPASPAFPPSRP